MKRTVPPVAFAVMLLPAIAALAQPEGNLLRNPGFEEPGGWSQGWTIENTVGPDAPYVYHLTAACGGHGEARPRTGDHAIEIYSSDRVTRLSQMVDLAPGRYRLAAWARNNGANGSPQLRLMIGERVVVLPAVSNRYRQYFGDFEVANAGAQRVGFVSVTLGLALDDISLTRVAADDPPPPYLFFDLAPTTGERSNGEQYYLRGQKQWVNFTISTIASALTKAPRLRIIAPDDVAISGLNAYLLDVWKCFGTTDNAIQMTGATRDGRVLRILELPVPRFINGDQSPVDFGGFWVEVPSGDERTLEVELLDQGRIVSAEQIHLKPWDAPRRQLTPRRMKVVSYSVQSWTMSAAERLECLPRQFAMMGMNVWSDYEIAKDDAPPVPSVYELVRSRAAREFGVKEFWPNFSCLLETGAGISAWADISGRHQDPDMFMVGPDGKQHPEHYSMLYAARKGPAWVSSALRAHQRTLRRPADLGLAYRNSGFITDALEGAYYSYDAATLADFAAQAGVARADVTVEALRGPLNTKWQAYNARLYAQVAANLAETLREVDPKAVVVNTAGNFGPSGVGDISLAQQTAWARSYDLNMPQWYAMGFYGSAYHDLIETGVGGKVYGKVNGHADVVPLLCLCMGTDAETPANLRFRIFDQLSTSSVVRGIGYYVGTYAFADGRYMAELSAVHTLLAQVEDYYALGRRQAAGAAFESQPGGVQAIIGMDLDGRQMMVTPEVKTTARVHRLGRGGRLALLTVISHCNQRVGERGVLRLDLKALGADPKRHLLVDHLAGATLPLTARVPVDTRATSNLALLEIADRATARSLVAR